MDIDNELQARIQTLLGLQDKYKKEGWIVETTVVGDDLVIEVYEKGVGVAAGDAENDTAAAAQPAAEGNAAAAQPAAEGNAAAAQPAAENEVAAAQQPAGNEAAAANLSLNEELNMLEALNTTPNSKASPELQQLEQELQLGKPAALTPESEASIALSADDKKAISTTLSKEDRAIAEQMYLKYKQLLHRVHAIPPSQRAKSNAVTTDDVNAMMELYSSLSDVSNRPNNRVYPYVATYDDLVRLLIKTCILYLFTTNAKSAILKSFKPVPGKRDLFTFTFMGATTFELPIHTTLAHNQATLVHALRANIEGVRGGGGKRRQTRRLLRQVGKRT